MSKLRYLGLIVATTLVLGFVIQMDPVMAVTIVPLECQEKTGGCNICDITKVFTNAANIISAALSAIALLMFVVGGLFWIFSGGVEQRVEMGKKIIIGTVTGLAIVFIAWFAVNVIVRTASLSGGAGSTTQLFSKKDWWSFEGCYPTVPTSCANLLTGDVCGNTGDCSGSSYDNPRCQCWRALSEDGDDKNCKTDGSVDQAGAGAKEQICACIDACRLLAVSTSKDYECVAENNIATPAQKANYSEIRIDVTCGVADSVCALPK